MCFYPDIIIVMQIFTHQNFTREFQRLIKIEACGGMLSVLFLLKNEQEKVRHKSITFAASVVQAENIDEAKTDAYPENKAKK